MTFPGDEWRSRLVGLRYLPVFASILGVLLAVSFVRTSPLVPLLLLLVLCGIAFGPLRLAGRPRWAKAGFVLLLALRSAGLWIHSPGWLLVADAAVLALFLLGCGAILVDVLTRPTVDLDTILGGCSVYLVAGISFAFAFSITESVHPGSFEIGGHALPADYLQRAPHFVYMSFVVLTSVGFGDILPISQQARGLAIMEAIFGQLYLAILIARLVSLHAARSTGS